MKEKDALEEFISGHRGEFDTERPSLKVWAQIEKQISSGEGRTRSFRWLRTIAASVLVIIGVGIGLMVYPHVQQYKQLQALNNSEEINGLEKYFNDEVEARFVELSGSLDSPDQKREFNDIDEKIDELKIELLRSPKHSREMIMRAIISSYEAKVDLLEKAIEQRNAVKSNYYETQVEL